MKKLNGVILLTGLFLNGTAQQKNFLYIQTDNKQPFYVKKGTDVHSSSMSGHVVLSGLSDSTYTLKMGFPRNEAPEQSFSYTAGGKDQGYILKNFGEKGWGLFNLQTLAVTMADNGVVKPEGEPLASNTNTDTIPASGGNTARPGGFIDRLALVVDDPSIRIKPEMPKKVELAKVAPVKVDTAVMVFGTGNAAEKKEVTIGENAGSDSAKLVHATPVVAVVSNDSNKTEDKAGEVDSAVKEEVKETSIPAFVPLKSNIVRKSMTKLDTGFMGVFIDEYSNGRRDTIRVFVPKDGFDAAVEGSTDLKKEAKEEAKPENKVDFLDFSLKNGEGDKGKVGTDSVKATAGSLVGTDSTKVVAALSKENTVEKLPDTAVTIIDTAVVVIDSAVVETVVVDSVVVEADSVKSGPGLAANEQELLELRRKMAAEATEEDMVDVARKYFRHKKFSVAQIRHLAGLFLKEEGRYSFLDTAYQHTVDKDQFHTLEDLLKETYYINRFKALVGR